MFIGLIPAHAGKTVGLDGVYRALSAHPRSRGENPTGSAAPPTVRGSSPLTRGKLADLPGSDRTLRLIPAHAGKTSRRPPRVPGHRAHPRSRGENVDHQRETAAAWGSSPLTRGKLVGVIAHEHIQGLIPAHAGKTGRHAYSPPNTGAHPRSRGENDLSALLNTANRGSSPLTRGKHFPTCAFTAQIDQILETLELAVSSGSYSVWVACATDAPQDQVRSIGLVLPSSRGAS